jgi:hypothetical protein
VISEKSVEVEHAANVTAKMRRRRFIFLSVCLTLKLREPVGWRSPCPRVARKLHGL